APVTLLLELGATLIHLDTARPRRFDARLQLDTIALEPPALGLRRRHALAQRGQTAARLRRSSLGALRLRARLDERLLTYGEEVLAGIALGVRRRQHLLDLGQLLRRRGALG